MQNFAKVNTHLFRCDSPSVSDVHKLFDKYDVRKIVSLDKDAGEKISRVCKLLGIKHIMLPIDIGDRKSLIKFLNQDISKLLSSDDGNVLLHCQRGKDRTGFAIALYRCVVDGWAYEKALKEANSFGFGIGVDPKVIELYKKILHKASDKDVNSLDAGYDIVDRQRNYPSDYADYSLDGWEIGSWSPYSDYRVCEFPYANVDSPNDEEDTTRITYDLDDTDSLNKKPMTAPQVGQYDAGGAPGMYGAGPSMVGSGVI
jgi:Tyrosine phosphatase family